MDFLKRIGGWAVALLLWIWAVLPRALDWVGRTTLPDDWEQLMAERLPAWTAWLFSTPWWVPALLAVTLTIWMMWVSWPRLHIHKRRGEDSGGTVPQRRYVSPYEGKTPAPVDGPTILFGSPRQLATEPDLSWWHVPILLKLGGPTEIQNCIVSMHIGSRLVPTKPIQMRWQSDRPNGDTEIALVAGRERFVPIMLRREPNEDQAKSRALLTNLEFLRDQKETTAGDHVFTLIIAWGGGEEISPHYYRIKTPAPLQSNGHFVLEIVPESENAPIDAPRGRRLIDPLIG